MDYYFTKKVKGSFKAVEDNVINLLKNEGFGVLTEIDIQKTLKKKLNVDFRNYKILGACHPPSAYAALKAEDKIGTLLPCNVILQEQQPNIIEVSAVNPLVSMQEITNKSVENVAKDITLKLEYIINRIKDEE